METRTIPVPPAVRQVLGDQAITEFIPWMEDHFRQILRREGVPRDEYRVLLSRLDGVEKELSLLRDSLTVTRAEFRADQAQTREEFRADQAQAREEFRADQAQLRSEFREELSRLRGELGEFQRRMDEQLNRVHLRIDELSGRVEARLMEMDHHLEARLNEMNARWEARLDRVDERLEQMYRQMVIQTRWLIGALLGIGTIISLLLAIAQFTP